MERGGGGGEEVADVLQGWCWAESRRPVYSHSLLASTMHAITEVRDVSERMHLANYLCLIYADL